MTGDDYIPTISLSGDLLRKIEKYRNDQGCTSIEEAVLKILREFEQ